MRGGSYYLLIGGTTLARKIQLKGGRGNSCHVHSEEKKNRERCGTLGKILPRCRLKNLLLMVGCGGRAKEKRDVER